MNRPSTPLGSTPVAVSSIARTSTSVRRQAAVRFRLPAGARGARLLLNQHFKRGNTVGTPFGCAGARCSPWAAERYGSWHVAAGACARPVQEITGSLHVSYGRRRRAALRFARLVSPLPERSTLATEELMHVRLRGGEPARVVNLSRGRRPARDQATGAAGTAVRGALAPGGSGMCRECPDAARVGPGRRAVARGVSRGLGVRRGRARVLGTGDSCGRYSAVTYPATNSSEYS